MRNKKLGIAKNFDIKNAWLVKIFSSFCRNSFLTPSRDHTEFFNGCIKEKRFYSSSLMLTIFLTHTNLN
jgi:hypothetical protein